jgi:hypothetical protein
MQPEGLSESSRRSKRSGDLRACVNWFAPWRGASSDTGEAQRLAPFQGALDQLIVFRWSPTTGYYLRSPHGLQTFFVYFFRK